MDIPRSSSIFSGIAATTGLLLFYFLTMRLLAGSWEAAFSQFQSLWIYMVPLSLGFGVQVGLYRNLRQLRVRPSRNLRSDPSSKVMAGSTTTSTISMIACCAHHLTDVLPIIGLSAVSIFLVNYQIPLLFVGLFSNTIGIILLLRTRKKLFN